MSIYTKEYFFNECEGYKTFLSSKGLKLSRRLLRIYNKIIELKPQRTLDFGCGRGELALNLALNWIESYGVDISDEALEIANDIRYHWLRTNPQMKLNFLKFNGEKLEFDDNFFDVIILSDVVEHLDINEINLYFKEFYRVLKKDGHIIIHTSPNKIFLNFGLKLYWLVGRLYGINLNWNMREYLPKGLLDSYHKNEQTSFSIERILKKHKFNDIKIEFIKNPHYVYYFLKEDKFIKILNRIYRFLPIKHLFFADIIAISKKV